MSNEEKPRTEEETRALIRELSRKSREESMREEAEEERKTKGISPAGAPPQRTAITDNEQSNRIGNSPYITCIHCGCGSKHEKGNRTCTKCLKPHNENIKILAQMVYGFKMPNTTTVETERGAYKGAMMLDGRKHKWGRKQVFISKGGTLYLLDNKD